MEENRVSWSRRDSDIERHKGSYDFEELKLIKTADAAAAKRKYALCFGYLGSRYQGLQINPGAKSIEAEVEKALYLVGAIDDTNFGYMHKIQWTRAARTDRGVHATSQCCAMKLKIDERTTFLEQLNRVLPSDIRVHAVTKTSKHFNSKLLCSKRKYNYLLPTYALKDGKEVDVLLNASLVQQGKVAGAAYAGGYVASDSTASVGGAGLQQARQQLTSYRVDTSKLATLRAALGNYFGTNRYHNFTTGISYGDAKAKRHILTFDASEPFVDANTGVEWVLLSVVGQSFLLNQIRKMVALAVQVTRGVADIGVIKESFTDKSVDIPMAPGVGLYLDELYFDGYNKKQLQLIEKDEKAVVKKLEKAATKAAAAADTSGDGDAVESAAKKPRIHAAEGVSAETSEDAHVHDLIDWSGNPATKELLTNFATDFIHPHVLLEEDINLHFLYFLDYVRAHPTLNSK